MNEEDYKTKYEISQSAKDERDISDKRYAPYLTWTILIGVLALFGVAIANKFIAIALPILFPHP